MSFSITDHNVDDPSDFDAKSLQALDENFRCPICKEFYEAALLLTTCSHSFCALCIRRSLNSEQTCPKCRSTAYENDLVHNYDLDNLVKSWRDSRAYLVDITKNTDINQTVHKVKDMVIIDNDQSEDFIPAEEVKPTITTTATTATRRSTRLSPPKPNIPEIKELTDNSMVECPICCQNMKYKVLNAHMDRCAFGDSSIPPSSPIQAESSTFDIIRKKTPINLGKKPTKVLYAMQNEKQMKELLRELGLPDHGDKALKVWRHREYLTLYNANCDSDSPVSANVLIQKLAQIEQQQMTNKVKRKSTDTEEHKEKYKSEFDILIETTKKRKMLEDNKKGKDKE